MVVSAVGIVQKGNADKSVTVNTIRKDTARVSWVDIKGDVLGVGVQIVETHKYANLW